MGMQKFDPGAELAEGTTVVHAGPCGLGSIILIGDGTNLATIKLYDHATTATGAVIKQLSIIVTPTAVYTPAKPDSFANGIVAVVTCASGVGTAYVSIDS